MRNRSQRKAARRKKKLDKGTTLDGLLSNRQKAIVRLDRECGLLASEDDRAFARSLLDQFNRTGGLSDKQWFWVAKLCQAKKHGPIAEYCVYGIQAGDELKIGMSNDPEKRAKAIQTGNAHQVKVVWVHRCESRGKALVQEKKLHRYCKEHWIRGEWFTLEALGKLRQWRDKVQGTKSEVLH